MDEIVKSPQYFVSFDEIGNISAFYVDDIHGENIPETAIPITFEEWQTYCAETWKWKRDGDVIREKTQQELDEERANHPPAPKSPIQQLEEENAFLSLELATTQSRLDQAEQEQADLLLMLVAQGVI